MLKSHRIIEIMTYLGNINISLLAGVWKVSSSVRKKVATSRCIPEKVWQVQRRVGFVGARKQAAGVRNGCLK